MKTLRTLIKATLRVVPGTAPLRRALGMMRHRASALVGDPSAGGEGAHLQALLKRLNLAQGGCAVDIAAADGVTQSCTLALFRDQGWGGLAVEWDAEKFARLADAYSQFPAVRLSRSRVTPANVVALLEGHEVPREFDLLNLDIDSYDLWVGKSLLEGGFSPRVISIEINESLPPPVRFSVLYSEDHVWRGGHFYGCSLAATCQVIRPLGYVLEAVEYNNAFFVAKAAAAKAEVPDRDMTEAYRQGYASRPDRHALFPANAPFECLQTMTPKQAVAFIDQQFAPHRGRYYLGL